MASYVIFTDAAVDMPVEDFRKYDIRVIPMDFMLGEESISYTPDSPERDAICRRLYAAEREGKDVHTSQIPPYRYIKHWEKELKAGNDLLYIAFSSGLSTTFENAKAAAEELREKYPERQIRLVDSKAATSGQGVFVEAAGINRDEKGMDLEANAVWLEAHVPKLCHRFTVGDLNYLHKGGRVSAATALIGGMLEIKPCMIIDDEGCLQVVAKATGKKMAMRNLIKAYQQEAGIEDEVPKLIFITHSANDEDANLLAEKVRAVVDPDTRIEVMLQSPIIGAHTGPWFVSLCGWGKHRMSK